MDKDYERIRAQLKGAIGGSVEKDEVFWTVIEGVAAVLDGSLGAAGVTGSPFSAIASGGAQGLYTIITKTGKPESTPNPWFVWNGQDEEDSKYTRRYLRTRVLKGLGAGAISIGSAAASGVTYVDVGGIAMNANALGSTSGHLYKLHAIAKSYKQSDTIAGWINAVIKMKAIKAGIRTVQLVGSSVPVPAVGLATGLGTAIAKLGVKLTMTKTCLATAADIHWRSFQEQRIARSGGAVGPASRISYELFARRGATRVFGKYDVDQLIAEPCGWMAYQDKLMLL